MLSNLKTMGFCDLCTILGFSRGFSVVMSPLSGWVLQGSLGVLRFQCITRGNAVEFENYGCLLSLYISGVLPGFSVVIRPFSPGVSVILSPLSGLALQGFLGGSFFFSVSKGGNAVEFENYVRFVHLRVLPGFSVVLSPFSGWVLQGSLGGSLFSVTQKRERLSKLKSMVFQYLCICFGFSRSSL